MSFPTKPEIEELFGHVATGDWEPLMARVSPNVDWTIMGTSPMSERFPDLKTFQEKTLARLGKILKEPLKLVLKNVVGGAPDGSQEWCCVEMAAQGAECIDGQPYPMTYNWVCRWDTNGQIVQVRAYLDTMLLTKVLRENEVPTHRTPLASYT